MLDLVANMLLRKPHPLPRWQFYDAKLRRGGNLLGALLVYNIPNLLLTGCTMTVLGLFPNDTGGAIFSLALLCCLSPLVLAYTVVSWAMLALGAARYAETDNPQALYQFGRLLRDVRGHLSSVAQWMIGALLVNLAVIALGLIPCLGWLAVLTLAMPWHGHMLGQFAVRARSWADRPSG
jgi:hypothetical protein